MSNFKLKLMLQKKGILLPFLIVCSLFMCAKALAVWDKKSCIVRKVASESRINIQLKFFEYNRNPAEKNSFLENFEAFYSTNDGKNYQFLMASMTVDQTFRTHAWIGMKVKSKGEKVDLMYYPYNQQKLKTYHWKDDTHPILTVRNNYLYENETWISVNWYPEQDLNKITHMQINGLWNEQGIKIDKVPALVYDFNKQLATLYSNSLNYFHSTLDHEIITEKKKILLMFIKARI